MGTIGEILKIPDSALLVKAVTMLTASGIGGEGQFLLMATTVSLLPGTLRRKSCIYDFVDVSTFFYVYLYFELRKFSSRFEV